MQGNKKIREELEDLAAGFQWPEKRPDFSVPEGYFDAFPRQVLQKIALLPEEVVPGAPGKSPYGVPEGYFDNLPASVLEKVRRVTPVIQLPRPHRKWPQWAVAAVIAAIAALGGLLWLPQNAGRSPVDKGLAQLSDAAILQYLDTETSALDEDEDDIYNHLGNDVAQNALISGLSDRDIEEYLHKDAPASF
ncbi:MAG TPA: hypothetical protein VFX43_04005 [Chitinophagaceae bacterium]|nr:hypothetical protein [Chitinophagaceae bacterium]